MKVPSREHPKRMFTVGALAGQAFYEKYSDHVFLLGAISVQWSTLEKLLFDIFRFMTSPNRHAAEITFYSLPSHHMRLNLVRRLTEELIIHERTKTRVLKLLDAVKECATRRNSLTHDIWVMSEKAIHRLKVGIVPKGKGDVFNEPLEPLIDFHRKLARLNQWLSLAILAVISNQQPRRGLKNHPPI